MEKSNAVSEIEVLEDSGRMVAELRLPAIRKTPRYRSSSSGYVVRSGAGRRGDGISWLRNVFLTVTYSTPRETSTTRLGRRTLTRDRFALHAACLRWPLKHLAGCSTPARRGSRIKLAADGRCQDALQCEGARRRSSRFHLQPLLERAWRRQALSQPTNWSTAPLYS